MKRNLLKETSAFSTCTSAEDSRINIAKKKKNQKHKQTKNSSARQDKEEDPYHHKPFPNTAPQN